jgi:hypothetical protein
MAKELWHLNKFNMQSWLNQRAVKKQQDGTLGTPDTTGDLEMPGGISVGDSYTYPPPAPAPSSGLLHAGIGAGLLAGGIGIAKLLGVGAATVASGPAAPIVAPIVNQAENDLSAEGTVLRLAK